MDHFSRGLRKVEISEHFESALVTDDLSYVKSELQFIFACADECLTLFISLPAASATRVRKEQPEISAAAEPELFKLSLAIDHINREFFGFTFIINIIADLEKCRGLVENESIGLKHSDKEEDEGGKQFVDSKNFTKERRQAIHDPFLYPNLCTQVKPVLFKWTYCGGKFQGICIFVKVYHCKLFGIDHEL